MIKVMWRASFDGVCSFVLLFILVEYVDVGLQ